ncbi:hypothetical protein LTR37_011982 [Vermiconidia calcicola]|uniref:Uncharacterized protein n=1 Tax=Vermiconidia calcicola TaxID=1690605 RepID=A0ACC3N0P1_9PEZI|nr:hypothetical protein LTR37_011982 [Vermiconidia calcicola]
MSIIDITVVSHFGAVQPKLHDDATPYEFREGHGPRNICTKGCDCIISRSTAVSVFDTNIHYDRLDAAFISSAAAAGLRSSEVSERECVAQSSPPSSKAAETRATTERKDNTHCAVITSIINGESGSLQQECRVVIKHLQQRGKRREVQSEGPSASEGTHSE